MSDSNRGTFFAIGLVAGVGLALLFLIISVPGFSDPSNQKVEWQTRDQHPAYSAGKEDSKPPGERPKWLVIADRFVSIEEGIAQWVMALFSIIATGVSFWAVGLVRDTLKINTLATNAAEKQARISERALNGLERPFIHIVVSVIDFGILPAKPDDFYTLQFIAKFTVILKNYGRTPAILQSLVWETLTHDTVDFDRISGVKLSNRAGGAITHFNLKRGMTGGINIDEVMTPSNDEYFRFATIGIDRTFHRINDMQDVGIYQNNIKFYGILRYNDFIGVEYEKRFCFIIGNDRIVKQYGGMEYNHENRNELKN